MKITWYMLLQYLSFGSFKFTLALNASISRCHCTVLTVLHQLVVPMQDLKSIIRFFH